MFLDLILSRPCVWWYVSHNKTDIAGIHKVLRSLWSIALLILDVQEPSLSFVMLDIDLSDPIAKIGCELENGAYK